jgi:hypothetical protein
MKKALFVAASIVGLSLIASPAFASTAAPQSPAAVSDIPSSDVQDWPTFGDAYNTFVDGGGYLGYGAASLVAGAYAGIATTPALISHSFTG